MSITYFGTGKAGEVVLSGLKRCPNFDIKAIYSAKPQSWNDIKKALTDQKSEAAIVCNYGAIIPEEVLAIPKFGFWNVHYSLLPKYRGATPVQSAILAGDTKSGVTIIQMVKKLDEGDVLIQQVVPLKPDETASEMIERYSYIAVALIDKWLPKFVSGKAKLTKQEGTPSYCYKSLMKRENARINWADSADKIYRMIRAFEPDPCAWSEFNGKELKIVRAKLSKATLVNDKPGTMMASESKVYIATKDQPIEMLEVSLAGKGRMSAISFASGYLKTPILLT